MNKEEIAKQLWYIEWASTDSKNYDWILEAINIIEDELKNYQLNKNLWKNN